MTSILVLRQSSSAHLATDSAVYNFRTGVTSSVNTSKCVSLPNLHCAFACTGPSEFARLFAQYFEREFETFDELIAGAEARIPHIFAQIAGEYRSGDAISTLYLIGWHQAANRPAAYSMDLWTENSSHAGAVFGNSSNAAGAVSGKLKEQILAGTAPVPELLATGFTVHQNDDDFDPELDLLHQMEVQRQELVNGFSFVGGKCLVTSIDQAGVRQKVVHHWAEDVAGELIKPTPVTDWKAWRAAHAAPPPIDFANMSRAKRELLKRKARKGKL